MKSAIERHDQALATDQDDALVTAQLFLVLATTLSSRGRENVSSLLRAGGLRSRP